MLDLSPTKLVIIFVVVIVLLGPKRLPQVARQLGAGWRKVVGLQQQLERELRESMPDLPSSQDVVRYARSPVSLLNRLAEFPGAASPVEDPGAPPPPDASGAGDAGDADDAGHWPADRGPATSPPASAPLPVQQPVGQVPATPAPALHPDGLLRGDPAALAADDPTMN